MIKWEYTTVEEFKDLKELGKNGWELVAASPSDGYGVKKTFYLKRKLNATNGDELLVD